MQTRGVQVLGGGSLLDNCILSVKTTKGNRTLYELKNNMGQDQNIYTPLLNSKNGKRLKFDLEKDVQVIYGSLDVRKKGLKAIITIGHITPYAVYGTDCGLENCNCDAFIKLIK